MDYCSSLRNLDQVKDCPNFKFVKGNICSADLIKYVLQSEQIDTIIHAAAQTHVDNSFGNSFAFTENNVLGTHVLLESAKSVGIKRFIHVSTDEVYGSSYQDEPCRRESDTLEPTNPYAATKAAAEAIARSYWFSFKMPVRCPHAALLSVRLSVSWHDGLRNVHVNVQAYACLRLASAGDCDAREQRLWSAPVPGEGDP